ncbi:30S ribosomal protein S14 [Streptomyces sp. NBC_00091]|uniref:30S ribosomal protein S14 n=1 Tax=Streptomyces sp. NBC_00091 TaxID=2975648 RepID=UPI00225862B1|nr:30S ribosomal protein S14 [Streptomyces sp. NBC_00091]MCX5380647.1 30S ribosomal protein S14 [Streptomyces sp. NBC_00091]
MAKRSKIVRNDRRREVVARYAARRAELKEVVRRPSSTPEERALALAELRRQPRDASATRVRNRDGVDGRPRGHLRKFGLSRIRMREQAHAGLLPGVVKSSW